MSTSNKKADLVETTGTGTGPSRAQQLKGFKHSKPGLLFSIGTSAFGAIGEIGRAHV